MANSSKTRSSASKRFKVTASGKIMRRQQGRSHLLTRKSSRRKRRMAGEREVLPVDRSRVGRLLNGQG